MGAILDCVDLLDLEGSIPERIEAKGLFCRFIVLACGVLGFSVILMPSTACSAFLSALVLFTKFKRFLFSISVANFGACIAEDKAPPNIPAPAILNAPCARACSGVCTLFANFSISDTPLIIASCPMFSATSLTTFWTKGLLIRLIPFAIIGTFEAKFVAGIRDGTTSGRAWVKPSASF